MSTTTHPQRPAPGARRWPRRWALRTLSISSLLAALSALAYRSFVHLPL